jgi:hypothetical protein
MNISKPLPGSITLEFRDQEWTQTIDYEHIIFRCKNVMSMAICSGIVPSMPLRKVLVGAQEKSKDGFTQVQGKKRPTQKKSTPSPSKQRPQVTHLRS